jgi:spermidine synthase
MVRDPGRFDNSALMLLYGASALLCQTLLLRELAVLFYGNELVLGILLFCWFAGTAAGVLERVPGPPALLLSTANLLAFLLVLAIRGFFPVLHLHGAPNVLALFALSTMIVFPAAFASGVTFVALSRCSSGIRVTRVYALEAAAFAGVGLLYTVILAGRLDATAILFALFLLPLAFLPRLPMAPLARVLLIALALLSARATAPLARISRQWQWRSEGTVLSAFDSRYQNVAIIDRGGQRTVHYGGAPLARYPLTESDEEVAVLPLLVPEAPRRVLVLGFARFGLLQRLLGLHPDELVNVSQDAELDRAATAGLDDAGRRALGSSALKVYSEDPFAWALSGTGSYDLILIPPRNHAKIGRASCRERVSNFV